MYKAHEIDSRIDVIMSMFRLFSHCYHWKNIAQPSGDLQTRGLSVLNPNSAIILGVMYIQCSLYLCSMFFNGVIESLRSNQ